MTNSNSIDILKHDLRDRVKTPAGSESLVSVYIETKPASPHCFKLFTNIKQIGGGRSSVILEPIVKPRRKKVRELFILYPEA